MQREISNRVTLGDTLNPYEDTRTASKYNNTKKKEQKIRDLINTGKYGKGLA